MTKEKQAPLGKSVKIGKNSFSESNNRSKR